LNEIVLGKAVAESATAVFAIGAAWFWFKSAGVKVPAPGTYWDQTPESDAWLIATRKSARFNRIAATFAGLSALSSALALWVGLVGA
jgi:hypothetical protein